MPVIVCECKVGIAPGVKARIATEITSAIREIILSPLHLISVVFHEATPENTYRSGEPTSETLIFCHIRDGRSDGAVLSLAKKSELDLERMHRRIRGRSRGSRRTVSRQIRRARR